MKKIAWIGTGVMGAQQAGHLAKAGYPVSAYTHKYEKLLELEKEFGIAPCKTVAQAVQDADVIFVMVGYPADVEEVFLQDGILDHAKAGALAIDMTTSSPSLAVRLYEEGKAKGVRVMDAPVSGGDSGARNGTLSIMVGGDEADFQEALPLFEQMGKNIVHMGPAGFGQHTKAANQIAVAGATAAYTEALVYAEKAGLDPNRLLEAIGAGAAGSWQLTNMAPRVLKGDLAPGFFVKHFIKDMKIVQQESRQRGVELEMLDAVLKMYEKMSEMGLDDRGTQALIQYYRK
ncbi:MAG: NAD(P)-dependent oxidoreductase [Clostridiaceae bacterium]|jgi:3-hydroxyisobutyrate dehydrogenase-like beta-hydroxyacid dehydrogenase|nr:NAD(P)-dependent oxidoreductase [Clostridiaceae bacterium]